VLAEEFGGGGGVFGSDVEGSGLGALDGACGTGLGILAEEFGRGLGALGSDVEGRGLGFGSDVEGRGRVALGSDVEGRGLGVRGGGDDEYPGPFEGRGKTELYEPGRDPEGGVDDVRGSGGLLLGAIGRAAGPWAAGGKERRRLTMLTLVILPSAFVRDWIIISRSAAVRAGWPCTI
jgi:hypothetical protein